MICAACMTPQKCGELGCKVLHPENHPPRAVIDSGLGHALNVAHPDEFPMQEGPPIPWALGEVLWKGYEALYGPRQSVADIAARGGFGWGEIAMWWKDRRFKSAVETARNAAPVSREGLGDG